MVSPLHAQPGSDSPLKMQQPEMLFGTGCMSLKGKCVCLESQKQHAPPASMGPWLGKLLLEAAAPTWEKFLLAHVVVYVKQKQCTPESTFCFSLPLAPSSSL